MVQYRTLLLSLALVHLGASDTTEVPNANHIFNAIHSSMRQWGSSLHHNGMTAFIATVPQGTQLYHGTHQSEPIKGLEWLAFEAEHALNFARPRGPGGPGRGGPGRGGPGNGPPDVDQSRSNEDGHSDASEHDGEHHDTHWTSGSSSEWRQRRQANRRPQVPLEPTEAAHTQEDEEYGYLHTYRPKRDLRLLYTDGQSAAKSSLGTLDLQDVVLLHDNPISSLQEARPMAGGPMGEGERAQNLCDKAAQDWNGRIDGIVRMELGFEIILCSFEKDLDVDRITRVGSRSGGRDNISGYKQVASRFDGIGGGRCKIDYEAFVTLFAEKDAVYFDERDLPRARNETKVIRPVLEHIKQLALQKDHRPRADWQAIADMVVARYSDRLQYMNSSDVRDLDGFRAATREALTPYIDDADRDATAEISRCATASIPIIPLPDTLAAQAILNVTTRICSSIRKAGEKGSLAEGKKVVQDLMSWLDWTTWKRCVGCSYDEVCFIPIWPLGGQEDFDHPKCISDMSSTARGYWGPESPGGPPGGPPGGGPPVQERHRDQSR